VYSAVAATVSAWRDSKDEKFQQKKQLEAKSARSKSYFEWSVHAAKLDALGGMDQEQRWREETRLYDRGLLEEKLTHLRRVRASGTGVAEQMFAVRADLMRNLGGITNAAVHEHFPVVPGPIREYIEEVRLHLEQITASTDLALAEKAAFLKETRHAFGRTALVLSGGGPLAPFHLGVVKALLEHGLLPRVLTGSSSGAVVCALVATRTDAELSSLLNNLSAVDLSFFSTATALQAVAHTLLPAAPTVESDLVLNRLRHMLGDLTFSDAYTLTGRVLSVSVSAVGSTEPPRLLNYLTAPHVVIWSAVSCSAALPGLTGPMELLARAANGDLVCFSGDGLGSEFSGARRWQDGSIEQELPLRGLSEMFSANHFVVSQTSLHVVPILNLKRQLGTLGQLAESEFKHRCRQAAEVIPRWASPAASWLRRYSQPWEGDVTIVLPGSFLQLRKSVLTPTHAELVQAAHTGELSTWAKLSAIQCNCGIEATLDSCIQKVTFWEHQERAKRRASAMPLKARCASMADLKHGLAQLERESSNPSVGNTTVPSSDDDKARLPMGHGESRRASSRWGKTVTFEDAAMQCVDGSALAFDVGTPRSLTGARLQSILNSMSARNSLDFIAP